MSEDNPKTIRIGILTLSDRASSGVYADESGPAIKTYLEQHITASWESVEVLMPDDREDIEARLIRLVDEEGCSLVVTTGGTGPTVRDVTPEATEAVCEKILPGFGEQMRAVSLTYVPTAILSRQCAGIRGKCLILNLPGKPRAIEQCLAAVFPAIPCAIELIGGPSLTDHSACS